MEISPASAADCKYKGSQVQIYAESQDGGGGGSHLCFHDVMDASGAHTYVVQGCMTTQPNGIHWTSENTCVRVSFNVEIGASWRLSVTSNLKSDDLCQPLTTNPDHDTNQLLADLPHRKLIFTPFTSTNRQLPHLHVIPERGRSNYNATCQTGTCSPYFYLLVITNSHHHSYVYLRNNEIRFARLTTSTTPPRKRRNRHRHRSRRKSPSNHRRRSLGRRRKRRRRGTKSSLHRKMLNSLQALVRDKSGKTKPTRFKILTT